jgi:uncharacterized protein YndB with AHSA1/START domain
MPQAQRSVIIERPVEEVFAFFTNRANDARWARRLGDRCCGAAPVGTTTHQIVASPGGRRIPADIEITAYEPSTHHAFRVIAGPVRPSGEYRFGSVGGGSDVAFTLAAHLGGLKGPFMAGSVQKSMDNQLAALDTAGRVLELN